MRIGVGVVFALHGWVKWQDGPEAVAGYFGSLGIPAPEIMAWVVIVTELVGGVFLVMGLLSRIWSHGMVIDMTTAMFTAHAGQAIFGGDGRVREVPFLLLFGALALLFMGPGKLSLDRMLRIERD